MQILIFNECYDMLRIGVDNGEYKIDGGWIKCHCEVRMSETINPYSASASPKMRIRIMPTKILSCCALARTPASPTMPIDNPAALVKTLVPAN